MAKNLPQHLNCPSHLKAMGEERAKKEAQELLSHLHAQERERLQQSGHQYAPLMHSRQPEVPVLKESPPEIDEQEMWDEFESGRSRTSLLDANSADRFNPGQKQEAEFIRALDRAGVNVSAEWGFMDFDIECDVDETQTNVMQGLGQL